MAGLLDLGGGAYYDPAAVLEYFQRVYSLSDELRAFYTEFEDLPERAVPEPSDTSDFEGRGYILRKSLEELLRDVDYIIAIGSRREKGVVETGEIEVPAHAPRPGLERVFIVHGHDNEAKESVARFVENLDLDTVVLHEKASKGQTIIEKLERHSTVDFAVVLLTPDDVGKKNDERTSLRPRARQNVLFELGFFVGVLGRARVCVLRRGSIELPTDYSGVTYIDFDDRGAWRIELARELKALDPKINLEKIV